MDDRTNVAAQSTKPKDKKPKEVVKDVEKSTMIVVDETPTRSIMRPGPATSECKSVMVEPGVAEDTQSTVPSKSNIDLNLSTYQKSLTQGKSVMQTLSRTTSTPIIGTPSTGTPTASIRTQDSKHQQKTGRRKHRKKTCQNPTLTDETLASKDTIVESARESLKQQLKKELAQGPPYQRITFEFDSLSSPYLKFKLSPDRVVIDLDYRSASANFRHKFELGDIIRLLNNRPIKNLETFYENLRTSKFPVSISIDRPIRIKPITENRMKRLNIKLNTGDRYFTAYLFCRPQVKLGITVKARGDVVVLIKVDEEGLGNGALEVGDVILDVDGLPVKTTEDTKRNILTALHKRGYVSIVIMRPMCDKSLMVVRDVMGISADSEHDPVMRIDSVLIGRTEAMRRKMDKARAVAKSGIYVKPTARRVRSSQSATMSDAKNQTMEIWSDVEEKDWVDLEPVPSVSAQHKQQQQQQMTSANEEPSKLTRFEKLKLLFTRFGNRNDDFS
ncbi:hypothetical protein M3Y96_00256800 [Aphelenchoides besseyi]|nr:hypothetical protein M3Y96_00256800 [Aphelenchoides besseyi]